VAWPARVAGGIAFAQVSAGRAHTCGVATDGVAYCWGDGAYGAVGDGDLTHQCAYLSDHTTCRRETPAAVSGGLRFVQIAAAHGLHTCGVTISGTAYCWGLATGDAAIGAAELGNAGFTGFNGVQRGSIVPVPVEGGLHFRSVTTGGRLSCGLTVDARAVCWGSNNFLQMGIGTASDVVASTRPRDVWIPTVQAPPALTDGMNACAVTTSGRIFCWGGENFFGELGSDPVSPSPPYHVCYRGVPTPIGEVDRSALCYN